MTSTIEQHDVLIIGQGAAAFAAALYAARYQMRTIVIGEMFGGETATGGLIENYPGYPEIDGYDLMLKFREQAEKYEVPIVDGKVESIDRTAHCFEARTDSGETYRGTTVILAVGRERRKLGLQHEDEWIGKGVSFCSTCDAPLHRGNVVAVVGGGDAAVKGAVLLSKYAERVYIVYRGVAFTRPEAANLRLLEQSGNVERLFNTNVIELKGNDGLSAIVLDQEVNGSTELAVNGIFIEIGADPRTELAHQLGILLNDRDEIIVDKHMGTNVHGVFAAGDVTDAGGDLKQTLTAAAQGALAATAAYADVSEHPEACAVHARGFSLV
ncbi:MAG: FAD-dependent oxidoreductase [Chloroflexi bacterium]|nr:FAD-dependent oxidoreductase [Chloroflexota bacterium]MCI0825828.1 FAD-dependent oxidoreductase [Chloroflexota bacterium]